MEISDVRALLSPAAQVKFDDVDQQRVLGASTHIRLIGDMLLDLAENGKPMEAVHTLAQHFVRTRGASSQAISNAIAMMMAEDDIRAGVAHYRTSAEKNADTIKEYLRCVLRGKKSLLLFDYSSTVAAAAELGKELGQSFDCYIPESRSLDGGRPYVEPFLHAGHRVHFFPDAALYHFAAKCDLCLIGSETFYPDGTCFNTVGSEVAALCCRELHVPFYIPTPMLKVDMRALYGHVKPPITDNHREKLLEDVSDAVRSQVDFLCPELVSIPPQWITAYITEEGILPPWAMYTAAVAYQVRLGGLHHEI